MTLDAIHTAADALNLTTKAAATRAINAEREAIEAVNIDDMPLGDERSKAARLVHAATRDLQSAREWRNQGKLHNAAYRVITARTLRLTAEALVK
jgi:hypothetical protein